MLEQTHISLQGSHKKCTLSVDISTQVFDTSDMLFFVFDLSLGTHETRFKSLWSITVDGYSKVVTANGSLKNVQNDREFSDELF